MSSIQKYCCRDDQKHFWGVLNEEGTLTKLLILVTWIKNQGSKDSQALPRRAEEVRRNRRLECPKAEVGGRSCSRGRIVKGRRVLGTGSAATVHASQPTLAVYKGLHRFQGWDPVPSTLLLQSEGGYQAPGVIL